MLHLLLFKCDMMCTVDLILSLMASWETEILAQQIGTGDGGGPDFWIQDVDLEPESRQELMQRRKKPMGSSLPPQRTLFGTTEQYCEVTKLLMWLDCRPLGEKSWAETTQSALPKVGSMMPRHSQVCTLQTTLKCLAREFLRSALKFYIY